MFDYLYEWIRNIAFYMILVTTVIHLLPGTEYKKYIRFFTGLVLILLMAAPVFKIFGMEEKITDIGHSKAYNEEIERIKESTRYLKDVEVSDYLGNSEEEENGTVEVEEIQIGR